LKITVWWATECDFANKSLNDLLHDVSEVHTSGKLQIFNVEVSGTYCIHTV